MTTTPSPRFKAILEAARRRDTGAGTDTMIVNSHLSQMKLFMLRQGIEFYPAQDSTGFRKAFIEELVEQNEIDCRLEGIVDDFLIDGKGLFFFRPVDDKYRILWFNRDNYRAYYDAKGELEQVDVIYSFETRGSKAGLSQPQGQGNNEMFVKMIVKRDTIVETMSREKPSFDVGGGVKTMTMAAGQTRTTLNSLGFIPAIEAFNTMKSTGMDASGEFDWLSEQIVTHDDLMKNIKSNIHFFGNPTLVSSRPKHDLMESGDGETARPTIASQAGFSSISTPSSRVSMPTGSGGGQGLKIPRIIANIEPTDRAVYLTPDAVSGDHNTYARQYREELLTALGGVDELGISSGATAFEIKSLYGRCSTTAARKCRGLLTYGLCKLLGLIIYNEEQIFRNSMALAVGLVKPVPPIAEDFAGDTAAFSAAMEKYSVDDMTHRQKVEEQILLYLEQGVVPPGVQGLIPDGNRSIEWRWKGPVFEDSAEDILNNSIVVRNLQETGVSSIEALRYLFPDKTDEERSGMLTGYPFRMAEATQRSIGTFIQLIQSMAAVPHPQAPDQPLLADPQLDLSPFLYRALNFLNRELTYAGKYNPDTLSGDPAVLADAERFRAQRGLDTSASRPDPTFTADGSSPADGAAAPGQSLANGVSELGREPERFFDLPAPGSLLRDDPTGGKPNGGGLPINGGGLPNNGQPAFGPADLLAPSNAGLFGSPDRPADRPVRRRVSRKRQ